MQDSRWSLVKSARQTGERCALPPAMTTKLSAWMKSNPAGTFTPNQPSRPGPLRHRCHRGDSRTGAQRVQRGPEFTRTSRRVPNAVSRIRLPNVQVKNRDPSLIRLTRTVVIDPIRRQVLWIGVGPEKAWRQWYRCTAALSREAGTLSTRHPGSLATSPEHPRARRNQQHHQGHQAARPCLPRSGIRLPGDTRGFHRYCSMNFFLARPDYEAP